MQSTIRWALCIVGVELVFLVCLRVDQLSLAPPLMASCLLLAANPQGVFAQPRTVLIAYIAVGHLGLLNSVFFENALFGLLILTLLSVGLMAIIPCIHPPAIGLTFLLAQTPSPFRVYFITLGLVGGIVLLHYLSQWLLAQLDKPASERLPRLSNESFTTSESRARYDSAPLSTADYQPIFRTTEATGQE